MASHSASMSRSLERMRRDLGQGPAMRFMREGAAIEGASDRTTEVYEMPGWSLADWSLAFLAAVSGLVAGFAAFVVLTTTQLAPDNGQFTPAAIAVAPLPSPAASKLPVVVEAIPAAEPVQVVTAAAALEPRAARERQMPRIRKARYKAAQARAERRVRRAANAR
jgi:hypothetical protein